MILSKADFLFSEELIGIYRQTLDIRKEFDNLIEDKKNKFIEKNSETIKNYNLNLANSLWRVYIKPGLTADSLFEVIKLFNFYFILFIFNILFIIIIIRTTMNLIVH
jgi:hypothetical protein